MKDRVGVHGLALEFELALTDACDVEEVIDQAGFELDVAADRFELSSQFEGKIGHFLDVGDGCEDGK